MLDSNRCKLGWKKKKKKRRDVITYWAAILSLVVWQLGKGLEKLYSHATIYTDVIVRPSNQNSVSGPSVSLPCQEFFRCKHYVYTIFERNNFRLIVYVNQTNMKSKGKQKKNKKNDHFNLKESFYFLLMSVDALEWHLKKRR